MEQWPKFIPEKIVKPEELKQEKDGYQIAVEAVDDLTNLMKEEKFTEEALREKASIISKNFPHIFAKEDDFFEVLPLALKLEALENLPAKNKEAEEILEMPETKMLSNDGYAILSNGIQGMLLENKKLPALNQEKFSNLFQSLLEVFWKGNFHTAPAVYDFLEKYKTELEGALNNPGLEEAKKDYAQLTSLLESNSVGIHLAFLVQQELDKDRDFLGKNKKAQEFVVGLLEKYGLNKKNSEDILNSWLSRRQEKPDKPNPPPVSDNFCAINLLEPEKPGIIKFLYEKLGIRNFDRYPAELLLGQMRDFDNQEKPYGIIINPANDWNGAFSQTSFCWEQLYKQLEQQGYALRVTECDSKIEIARRLIGFDREYGKNHKISFAFIGGHGTKKTIEFGGDKPINTLHIDDMAGRGAKRSSKFFEEDPTIVLVSCSTGVDKGIGEKLSETLGAKVIAPDEPTNIVNINVAQGEKGLDFDIKYDIKYAGQEPKKTFVRGRKE